MYVPSEQDLHILYQKLYHKRNLLEEGGQKIKNEQSEVLVREPIASKVLSAEETRTLLDRLNKPNKSRNQFKLIQPNQSIPARNHPLKASNRQRVEDRLLEEGNKLTEKKQQNRLSFEEYQKKVFTSKPSISRRSMYLDQKPIQQRVESLIQEKNSKREVLKEKYKPNFKSQIDPYSDLIIEIRKENYGEFANRAETLKAKAEKKKTSIIEKLKQEEKDILTFKPSINHRTFPSKQPKSTKRLEKQKQHLFHPAIDQNSKKIANKQQSADKQWHERLYDHSRTEDKKQYQQRYSHTPQINNLSRILATSNHRNRSTKVAEFSVYEEVILD